MPITFRIIESKNYFISTWSGKITDSGMLNLYKSFYEGPEWLPGLNELCDMSRADLSNVTSEGARTLGKYVETFYKTKGITSSKTATFCPTDCLYGMARLYQVRSEGSPELTKVFRDYDTAESWLNNEE